jgi:hypothetical protein
VVEALGHGDASTGLAVITDTFGLSDTVVNPRHLQAEAVRAIGHGSFTAGRRVLEKFVKLVRTEAAKKQEAA